MFGRKKVKAVVSSVASYFSKRADTASGPVALCNCRLLSNLWTSRGLMDIVFIAGNGLRPLSGAWLVSDITGRDFRFCC